MLAQHCSAAKVKAPGLSEEDEEAEEAKVLALLEKKNKSNQELSEDWKNKNRIDPISRGGRTARARIKRAPAASRLRLHRLRGPTYQPGVVVLGSGGKEKKCNDLWPALELNGFPPSKHYSFPAYRLRKSQAWHGDGTFLLPVQVQRQKIQPRMNFQVNGFRHIDTSSSTRRRRVRQDGEGEKSATDHDDRARIERAPAEYPSL
ncbi:hypothetical protein B0H16DRAFT_1474796 [Mycena metata]|uniref:Uncharacterized protein n=1 Tax=Mycena metata TaxID=1033252 RepID=A0AAD7HGA6_9AGAR|nr:hypothetical protein B0H16DRAFT_1474796 [Mycena metata]